MAKQRRIPVKDFLLLWDMLLEKEWKTDSGLCQMIGISTGSISNWRAGKVKDVLPATIGLIQEKLGYKISRTTSNEWEITKIGEEQPPIQPTDNKRRRAEADDEWGAIRELLEAHGIDSLNKARRHLQRCEELEGLFMSFETRARSIKLRDEELGK